MFNNNEKLKQLLIKAGYSVLTELEAAELVKISRIIISSHLRKNKYYYINTLQQEGLDVIDIALDAIGEAFNRDNDKRFIRLNVFINSLNTPLKEINPCELFTAYYRFLNKIADAHISRTYAQLDPNGFKIQRNIKETIAKMPQFNIRKSDLGFFYRLGNYNGSISKKPDYETIEKEFLFRSLNKKNTKELLGVIAEILSENGNDNYEIALNDLVKLFKKHFKSDDEIIRLNTIEDSSVFELTDEYEVKEFCGKVLIKIKQKAFVDYFLKNKVTQHQAIAMVESIKKVIDEWLKYGENIISYYEHYSNNYKISKQNYDIYIKSKLEYLIKEAKKELALYFYTRE